jgi:ribosomal protein L37AE/L43A
MMTEKKQEKQKENPNKCKRCGSGFGYIQIKTGNWVCRSCGYIENLLKVKREIKN